MTMNKSKKSIMDSNKHMHSYIEIIPDRLVFVTFKREVRPLSNKRRTYIRVDDFLHYEGFFNDFGPYNVCNLYHYCRYLALELEEARKSGRLVVQYTSTHRERRLNSAFAIGFYAVVRLAMPADDVHRLLTANETLPFAKFNDASASLSEFKLSLLDCLRAAEKALRLNFLALDDFNYLEYEHYERVESGDLNWIVPGTFLAFCGPHRRAGTDASGYTHHAPDTYFEYFRKNRVTTVVRLNFKFYDAAAFTGAGFEHHDLIFRDGSTPTDTILAQFLEICESAPGAVAVHCKAGLGRTGSLIGAYIMKHYRFTAGEAIAWLRLCRPGSVIGHQQQWLEEKQPLMWAQGESFRRERGITLKRHAFGIYSHRGGESGEDGGRGEELLSNRGEYEGNCGEGLNGGEEEVSNRREGLSNRREGLGERGEREGDTVDAMIGEMQAKAEERRSRSVTGISAKVDTMRLNDEANGNAEIEAKANDKNGNAITTTSTGTKSYSKLRPLASLMRKVAPGAANTLPTKLPSTIESADQVTQGDELNHIKCRRAAHHQRSLTASTATQSESLLAKPRSYQNRAKSQSTARASDQDGKSSNTTAVNSSNIAKPINKSGNGTARFAYVVVRTTANSTVISPSAAPIRTEAVSHIPVVASSNKQLIISKPSKDDGTKRASVRRATLSRSRLSRSPVKPLTSSAGSATLTNHTITTTTASSQQSDDAEISVARSRICRFCPPQDDSAGLETTQKRGKRSMSGSRFYEKKNVRSKKQILTPAIMVRRPHKEVSLDPPPLDVAASTNQSSDSAPPPPKEPPKSRLKKPTIRSPSSQKIVAS